MHERGGIRRHPIHRSAQGIERDAPRSTRRAPDVPQPLDAAEHSADPRLVQGLAEEIRLGKERHARQAAAWRCVARVDRHVCAAGFQEHRAEVGLLR